MAGRLELEVNMKNEAPGTRADKQAFNLLFLGNFSGNAAGSPSSHAVAPGSRKIAEVNLDTASGLWKLYSPSLNLTVGTSAVQFAPRSLDDFHPDHLFRNLPLFQKLRETRARLLHPDTAESALDELLNPDDPAEAASPDTSGGAREAESGEDSARMLERLLGRPAGQVPVSRSQGGTSPTLDHFIRDLVAPHIVLKPDAKLETAVASLDLGISELMRSLLHHEQFQALESTWRSLLDTVSELELGEEVRLFACDIRREELLAGLPDPGVALQDCALIRLLVEQRRQAADDTPFAVIIGNYYFGPNAEDIALLTALGAAAAMNHGIFLAGARPEILGCSNTAELADARYWSSNADENGLWQSLRHSPIASRIGLSLPRVLGRLPYGAKTEAIESFEFEEMPDRNHADYLWKNPAVFCGRLLAEQFLREGWNLEPGSHLGLGDLPAHHYTENGESILQPCAELLLSESTMVAMLDQGLMPIVSFRNQNTAVLGRFQSIASPPAALKISRSF